MLHFIHNDETIAGARGFTAETSGKEGCLIVFKIWEAPPSLPLHVLYDQTPAASTGFPPEYTI